MTESPAGRGLSGALGKSTATSDAGSSAPLRGPLARSAALHGDLRFILLTAVVSLEAMGIGVLFPILAHVQQVHHLPTYALGLMSGASFFAALVAQVAAGPFLDGTKARRFLLAGVVLGAGGLVWFSFGASLLSLVGARAIGGVGYGIVGPAALREATVGVSGARRGSRLGVLSSAQMAGIVVGPLFGSVLYAAGGIRLPFEVVAALLAVVGLAIAFAPASGRAVARTVAPGPSALAPAPAPALASAPVPPLASAHVPALASAPAPALAEVAAEVPAEPGTHAVAPAPPGRFFAGLPLAPLLSILLLGAALQLPNGLYDALWSRMLTDRGAGALLIGLSLTLFGVPFVLLAPLGGRLAERRGPLLAGGVGLIIADCFMASYGFVPSPYVILALGVGEACVQSVAIPGGFAAVARVFPEDRAATGQGWFGGCGTAAAGAAAVVGAPVYAAFGPGAAFAGGAVLSALLVVAALAIGRRGTEAPGLQPVARSDSNRPVTPSSVGAKT